MSVLPARAGRLVLVAALSACGGAPRERIVLITLDTARYDALESMPETAAVLAGGTSFSGAYSATSTTQPTHASLFTGLHPWQHGVTKNGEVLPESAATVAEALRSAGFSTGAVVASYPLARRSGFAQGFEQYRDEFRVPYVQRWEGEEVEGNFYSFAATVTDEALAVLAELDEPRQFLWVHYYDAHDPYGDAAEVPAPMPVAALLDAGRARSADLSERVAEARALYARDLAALDRSLARLLTALAADGVPTHVILTSDHGESLGERGCVGHGKRLVPEQVRVPLVILSPRVAPGARDDTAGSVDVAATILSLAGLEPAGGAGRDLTLPAPAGAHAVGMRRSARPEQLLDGRELPVEGARFFLARGASLLAGDEKGVVQDDEPERPVEAEGTAELRALFATFAAELEGMSVETLDDEDVLRALKALGYD